MEEAFESAAVIDNKETTETNFQKNFLDEEAGEIMGSDVVGGIYQNESGEIAHSIHEVSVPAIIGNITGCPEIDVEDVERATEGPRKNELAVAGDRSVGRDAVGTLKNPIGNILATVRPEESKTNPVQSLVNAHMASGRGGMVGREDVATEGQWNNDQHQHFLVVLDRLEDDKLAVQQRKAVLTNVIAVRRVEGRKIRLRDRGRGRQTLQEKLGIRVLMVGGSPIKSSRNRPGGGDGVDKGAGDEFSRRIGSID